MKKNQFKIWLGMLGTGALMLMLPWMAWGEGALFTQANEAYRAGQFQRAAEAYDVLCRDHPGNGVYAFNLGNAYFRMKKLGLAILAYERALQTLPRDADVRYNLNYVNGLLEYRVKDKRNWYVRMAEKLSGYFTYAESLVFFLACLACFLGSWLYVLAVRRGLAWGWIRKGFLVLVILSGMLLGIKSVQLLTYRPAIVIQKDAEVHYGPSGEDQVAFRLGEGLKVYVLVRGPAWSRIWLANREGGWIRNEHVELVSAGVRS